MNPSYSPSRALSRRTSTPPLMAPPARPNPVELVVKLAQRSLNHQLTSNDNPLWSQDELKWIAQTLTVERKCATASNLEMLQQPPRVKNKSRVGPIKSKKSPNWSAEEIKTLQALYKQNVPLNQIALHLGRTKNACSHKLWEKNTPDQYKNLLVKRQLLKEEAAFTLITLTK